MVTLSYRSVLFFILYDYAKMFRKQVFANSVDLTTQKTMHSKKKHCGLVYFGEVIKSQAALK
jgi:hypothetical protein